MNNDKRSDLFKIGDRVGRPDFPDGTVCRQVGPVQESIVRVAHDDGNVYQHYLRHLFGPWPAPVDFGGK